MRERLLHVGSRFEVRAGVDRRGRAVAVKRARRPDDDAAAAHLRQEAALLRRVGGAGLIPVIDTDDGSPRVVTPLVEAGDLGRRVERTGPLPVDEARTTAADVFAELAALHDHGVVHGAIRPSEVLLADRPRLIDPDIGGERPGEPGPFTAPEVAAGDEPSPASDVWSLAAVCRWAGVGGDGVDAVLARALDDDLRRRPTAREVADLLRRDLAAPATPPVADPPTSRGRRDGSDDRDSDASSGRGRGPRRERTLPDPAATAPGARSGGEASVPRRGGPTILLAGTGAALAAALLALDGGALQAVAVGVATFATGAGVVGAARPARGSGPSSQGGGRGLRPPRRAPRVDVRTAGHDDAATGSRRPAAGR